MVIEVFCEVLLLPNTWGYQTSIVGLMTVHSVATKPPAREVTTNDKSSNLMDEEKCTRQPVLLQVIKSIMLLKMFSNNIYRVYHQLVE